ncbi:unnamed protein product [Lactuca virosa]|uniref:Uncharacterized protein n=1 Tax=Lactuca virosa TaxID=75947 RepID=A0AAU9MWK0_9ASTR|nr:unnamed protein product [Lactuca virosa]
MEDDDDDDDDVNGCTQMLMGVMEELLNPTAKGFYDMLEDVDEPLWDGCENYSKLQAAIELLHWKSEYNISEAAYDHILPIIKQMLSKGEKLVENFYETKKLLKEPYESSMVAKFGDDTSCHPLFDNETWCDVSGGVKKGRIYGFGSVSDPASFLEGTSSTITSQEVVYECVRNEMRGEMDDKAAEMEAKQQQMREEMDAKVAAIDAKQQQIDAKYEAMEKMYATLQNMMGS